MRPLIETRNLCKTYVAGEIGVPALVDVSVSIASASFVAIMGPSGSGKSTFMNIIGCLDRPTSGQYLLQGMPIESLSRDQLAEVRNQRIGFVFQNFNLLPRFSAVENVQLPLLYSRTVSQDPVLMSTKALQAVGLGDRTGNFPSQLSGGQQQRVAIARAIVGGPQILLADEPTGALDSKTSHQIMTIFQALQRSTGVTVIVVTHSDEVASYAGRIIRFKDGRIVDDVVTIQSSAPPLLSSKEASVGG